MLTDGGPVLLECNARLGDPETQVILPRLATALGPILAAASRGDLLAAPAASRAVRDGHGILPVLPTATVGIVLAAEGYPGTPKRGEPIRGLDAANAAGALVFHAGTVRRPGGGYGTNGGRVLTVVGRGPSLAAAREAAERGADAIAWEGMQRRRDIAVAAPAAPASLGSAA
jgi:phosphoribosylamine--glycine ligase